MGEEDGEEWDADFLDQLIQVEEFALSSTLASATAPATTTPTTTYSYLPAPPPPPLQFQQTSHVPSISYSPPRELSQRPPPPVSLSNVDAKDFEIDRLKGELGRVSEQLTQLEQECVELRKKNAEKDDRESGNLAKDVLRPIKSKVAEDRSGFEKNIGVQTDDSDDDRPSYPRLSEKLRDLWASQSDQQLGRNLMSKLLITCAEDFTVLFGSLSMNMCSNKSNASKGDKKSSRVTLQDHLLSFHTFEATKVETLYSVLTKVGNQMLPFESMLQPLLSLCQLENATIIHCSLRILHEFLRCLLLSARKPLCVLLREKIRVEGHRSQSNVEGRGLFNVTKDAGSLMDYCSFGTTRSSDLLNPSSNNYWNNGLAKSPRVNWVSLFHLMSKISVDSSEEYAKSMAVSIQNLILMSSNALEERERFFHTSVLESIGHLLKKNSGCCVQKEALLLLFLLLNCPKILRIFCSADAEDVDADASNNEKSASAFERFGVILEGLSDCLACSRDLIEGIEVRRRAIILLAFLSSSGKPGFQVLVSRHGETNFLVLILQMLASETERETSDSAEPTEVVKARILLIREALILLNRLVSNTGYSGTVMQVLTASRDVASLTIDIASRLSRKEEGFAAEQADRIERKIRESDIVDLARVFKKRVFSYLGDRI